MQVADTAANNERGLTGIAETNFSEAHGSPGAETFQSASPQIMLERPPGLHMGRQASQDWSSLEFVNICLKQSLNNHSCKYNLGGQFLDVNSLLHCAGGYHLLPIKPIRQLLTTVYLKLFQYSQRPSSVGHWSLSWSEVPLDIPSRSGHVSF